MADLWAIYAIVLYDILLMPDDFWPVFWPILISMSTLRALPPKTAGQAHRQCRLNNSPREYRGERSAKTREIFPTGKICRQTIKAGTENRTRAFNLECQVTLSAGKPVDFGIATDSAS